MTIPDVKAVVALVDPVVLSRMVTIGLEDSKRMSVDGIQIYCTQNQYLNLTSSASSKQRGVYDSVTMPSHFSRKYGVES